ncbi:hypothetical protein [Nostoc sp. MG11]|nr:hypothetical protein [Nostoc sp. MG11]
MPEAILLRRRYAIAEKIKSMNKLFAIHAQQLRITPIAQNRWKPQNPD